MSTSADLVVLGAGPAGLAAAWWAAAQGRSVVVLERAPAPGGLAASFEVADVRVDHGSHRLHPATPPHLLAALRRLLGDDLQTRPRHGRLRLGGAWVGFPLRPAELARRLPPSFLAGLARDAVVSRPPPRADTYAAVLRAGLGPTLYDALYAPYAEKLWGLPPEQIAGEQARRRVRAATRSRLAAKLVARPTFSYPRRGFGQIVDALADAAVQAGASLRCSTAVTAVAPGRVTADAVHLGAGHILSTVPITALARLAGGPAVDLRMRAMVLVYLVHEGGRWSPYDAHYLPASGTPVSRLSEPANYRVSADDPTDRTVLCAELPCAVGDPVWSASDVDLAATVLDALARTGLPSVRLAEVVVRRLPHVYPVYERGSAERFATLDAWATALPGVTSLGRLGLFAHDNTHHTLAMAWDAVAALRPGGGFDEAAWAAARQRFATHVVED